MKNLKHWLIHYFIGLLAQSWNGGVSSVVAIMALDGTGKLPEGITFGVVWHTFVVALGIHAVLYFKQNPIPATLNAPATA